MKSKMNYKISFQEMNRLAKEVLSNQLPTTLEEAKNKWKYSKRAVPKARRNRVFKYFFYKEEE